MHCMCASMSTSLLDFNSRLKFPKTLFLKYLLRRRCYIHNENGSLRLARPTSFENPRPFIFSCHGVALKNQCQHKDPTIKYFYRLLNTFV